MNMPSTDSESKAIHRAVSDYFGGWDEANVEQISRSLHAGLAKGAIRRDGTGKEFLHRLTKEQMLAKTKEGGGSDVPAERRHCTITILDRYEEIATVKVVSHDYVEYIHLAKQDGQWLIVNTLYTLYKQSL